MGTLRKLKRSGHGTGKKFESISWEPLPGARKMSEVLLDFAEPLLNESDDDVKFGAAISIAAISWNMAIVPPREWEAVVNEVSRDKAAADVFEDRGIREIIHSLVDRKKALFGDDNRLILNYEIIEEETGPRLLVASAPAKDGMR